MTSLSCEQDECCKEATSACADIPRESMESRAGHDQKVVDLDLQSPPVSGDGKHGIPKMSSPMQLGSDMHSKDVGSPSQTSLPDDGCGGHKSDDVSETARSIPASSDEVSGFAHSSETVVEVNNFDGSLITSNDTGSTARQEQHSMEVSAEILNVSNSVDGVVSQPMLTSNHCDSDNGMDKLIPPNGSKSDCALNVIDQGIVGECVQLTCDSESGSDSLAPEGADVRTKECEVSDMAASHVCPDESTCAIDSCPPAKSLSEREESSAQESMSSRKDTDFENSVQDSNGTIKVLECDPSLNPVEDTESSSAVKFCSSPKASRLSLPNEGSSVQSDSLSRSERDGENVQDTSDPVQGLEHSSTSNTNDIEHESYSKVMNSQNDSFVDLSCNGSSVPNDISLVSDINRDDVQAVNVIDSDPTSSVTEVEDELLAELNDALGVNTQSVTAPVNGVRVVESLPEFVKLRSQLQSVELELHNKETLVKSLQADNDNLVSQLQSVTKERDRYLSEKKQSFTTKTDDILLAQIKELENLLVQTQKETKFYKEKLTTHDAAAKKAITEFKTRLDKAMMEREMALREREDSVMKYASRESKVIDLVRVAESLELKLKDMSREKEVVNANFRALKIDKQKITAAFDSKCVELNGLQKELEKHKELVSTGDVRVKWAQNKLKSELEAHKETKGKLEDMTRKWSEAKEETEIIRKDCQAMIKTYQECEEIKSNSLDLELKKRTSELQQFEQEKSDVVEVHEMTKKELDSLKIKYKDLLEEVKTLRDKVHCHEEERLTNEGTMNKFREIIQNQKRVNKELQENVKQLEEGQAEMSRKVGTVDQLTSELDSLKQEKVELDKDMELCRSRETDMLELTERMTAKNAQLQSENSGLQSRVMALSTQKGKLEEEKAELLKSSQKLSSDVSSMSEARQSEIGDLSEKVREKSLAIEELTVQLEDQKNENRTLKRKHTTNVKELSRELQQLRRKLENYENQSDNRSGLSMESRTSSNGSLDTLTNNSSAQQASSGGRLQEHVQPDLSCMPEIQVCEPDRQKLIEKVVKLQKAHARKNEKLEFMDDHIKQMIAELKKKNKIIQSYVLREEAGALIPESMDENKAQLSRKGGVMASVYHSQTHDSHMTLDLSLQINHKLQAVLEDTILKNITLKESLDTLGTEISRLSQENRQLQLHLQGES